MLFVIQKRIWKLCALLLLAFQSTTYGQPAVIDSAKGLQVLFIGDSNTEIGNITTGLSSIFDSIYGNDGSGYFTVNPNSMGLVPGNPTIECDSNWVYFDMRNAMQPEPAPYYSPNGLSIYSSAKDATTIIQFSGEAIDLYYLQTQTAGDFFASVDGGEKIKVGCKGSLQTKKISLHAPGKGQHKLMIENAGGTITLLGVDIKTNNTQTGKRHIVHKWGNAWASSEDIKGIDETVFNTALQVLQPNLVVLLIGTNDYNLDDRSPVDFKNNLTTIITSIKKAHPGLPVMIVSTFDTDGEKAKALLPQYVASSFPEAARETRSYYFNLYKWFGSYSVEKLPDGLHVNKAYGKKIAEQLYREIRKMSSAD